jgi:hypothetical protein
MMESIEDLKAKIAVIEKVPPCPTHGRSGLEICPEPGCNVVRCMATGPNCGKSCRCWNDE